jgi:hypothetical protein
MNKSRFFSPINVALAAGVLASLGTAGRARAATFHVATAQELQTTLNSAAGNGSDDTILFAAGIYSGTFTFNSTEAQSLTLLPETNAPVGQVVIAGSLAISAPSPSIIVRGVTFQGSLTVGVQGAVSFIGCVFQGGYFVVNYGGAFTCSGCLVTLGGRSMIRGCASASLDHNTFQGNAGAVTIDGNRRAGYDYAMTGPVSFVGNRVIGDRGGEGRPPVFIYSDGATVVSNNVFQGNTSGAMEVAYASGNLGSVVCLNNQFLQNSGGNFIMHCSAPSVVFQGNTVQGNSAAGYSIASLDGAYVTCVNNLLVSNSQNYFGTLRVEGAITNWVANNTIYGNTGNGLKLTSGSWNYVHNNIIWGNSGSDITVTTGANRFLYNNNYHSIASLVDLAVNNIDVDPLFVDAPGGDYHLRANSRCLNAGLNSSTNGSPALPLIDKDGNVRIADGTVDLGAYEQATTDQHPADTDTNWVMTVAEFTAYATAWTNRAAWATGPNPIPIDYVTRAGYLAGTNSGAYHNAGGGKPRNWQPGF